MLRELEQAGVRDEDITLLCGIGMHRPSTPEEKVAKLGQAVVDRYRVIDNEPQNPDALVDLGVVHGIPALGAPGGLRGRPADRHRAASSRTSTPAIRAAPRRWPSARRGSR